MPFIGLLNGKRVIPEGVEKGTTVECPECGDQMYPWGPSVDGTARHFKHHAENRDCETVTGESDTHRKLKSLAVSGLRTVFGDRAERCAPEVALEAPISDHADHRRADALVDFIEPDDQLGTGLIVEVQYRHEDKDIKATTDDYLAQEYSVVWADGDDFADDQLILDERNLRRRAREIVWPERAKPPSKWRTEPFSYRRLRGKWRRAGASGLTISGAPATLPPEWCDEVSLRLWREQDWSDLFPEPGAECDDPDLNLGHVLSGDHEYLANGFIQEIRESVSAPLPPVTLPPEWCDETACSLWHGRNWDSLFPSPKAERLDGLDHEYQPDVFIHEVRESLRGPAVRIDWMGVFPEDLIFRWFNEGLSAREDTLDALPHPSTWSGTSNAEDARSRSPEAIHFRIPLPAEYLDHHREDLHNWWQLGAGDVDFEVKKRLSEKNSQRRCAECGEWADWYLLKSGVLSEYRCSEHAADLVD